MDKTSSESYISRTSGLKSKDYVGYALGDVGCNLVFALVTGLLQKFYTDIFQINALWIMIMMILTRVWDAVNDPIMGFIADTTKPGKNGRYRRWMIWAGLPLAAATVLIVTKWPGLGETPDDIGTLIYVTFTYVLFDMAYTVAQVPYGSLVNVITSNEEERNKLSMFRSVGAGLGSLPVILLASFCYKDRVDEFGNVILGENNKPIQDMLYTPILIGAIVLAAFMLICYLLCYKMTKERIILAASPKRKKGETAKILKALLSNRAFLSVSIASMLLLAAQMFTTSYYLYLFSDYFGKGWLNTINSVATYLPLIILLFFSKKLIRRFGKSELCAAGIALSAVANLILFACRGFIADAWWLFMVIGFFNGCGQSVILLQIWSLIATAIDDVEVKTGIREEGTAYSTFMFFRKVGQMIAAVAVNGALLGMKYKAEEGAVQSAKTLATMYDMATLIPALMFGVMAAILFFWNPLNKKAIAELQEKKEHNLKELYESRKIIFSDDNA